MYKGRFQFSSHTAPYKWQSCAVPLGAISAPSPARFAAFPGYGYRPQRWHCRARRFAQGCSGYHGGRWRFSSHKSSYRPERCLWRLAAGHLRNSRILVNQSYPRFWGKFYPRSFMVFVRTLTAMPMAFSVKRRNLYAHIRLRSREQ